MKLRGLEPACPLTTTVTGTTPPTPLGLTAVQLVVLLQLTPVAWVAPKEKAVAPAEVENPAPEIVTVVPPPAGPLAGVSEPSDGT